MGLDSAAARRPALPVVEDNLTFSAWLALIRSISIFRREAKPPMTAVEVEMRIECLTVLLVLWVYFYFRTSQGLRYANEIARGAGIAAALTGNPKCLELAIQSIFGVIKENIAC